MYGRTAASQVRESALVISSPRPIFGFVDTFDLIIVGGGPAGATAALYAQRQGLSTALVDKEHFPRDKICGDALSGKSVAILHALGLLEEVSALPGAAITRIIFASPAATAAAIAGGGISQPLGVLLRLSRLGCLRRTVPEYGWRSLFW